MNLLKPLLSALKTFFLELAYPSACLHCEQLLASTEKTFCRACLGLLSPLDPGQHCPRCFAPKTRGSSCRVCKKRRSSLAHFAAVFEYLGPAACMVRQFKYSAQFYLTDTAGAYLALQLLRLSRPLPDVIVPVPISNSHWLMRGYNQSELLARAMSRLLSIPVKNALRKSSLDYSQAAFPYHRRRKLPLNSIRLKGWQGLADKRILLVDDVATTGSTLERCALALQGAYPASIDAISFCTVLKQV